MCTVQFTRTASRLLCPHACPDLGSRVVVVVVQHAQHRERLPAPDLVAHQHALRGRVRVAHEGHGALEGE